jgi:hypothetical protein
MRRLGRAAALGMLGMLLWAPVTVAVAAPPATPPPPPEPLDLAALAKPSRTVDLAEEVLRAALVKGKPDGMVFATPLDLGDGGIAVAWSECSKAGCRGSVATLTGGADHPKLARQAALVAPAKVFFADGFAFEAPALADLDGDGAPEIILHYTATEPPRAALGSLFHEYVAVYAPKDLSLMFSHELRRAGGDSEEACQWTLARSGDRLIASGACNTRTCLEATPPPAGCKPTRKLLETWRKPSGKRCYVRVPSAPSAPASPPPSGLPRR